MNIQITILVNKTAGNGNAEIALNKVVKILNHKKITYHVIQSNYSGELVPLAKKYADQIHDPHEYLLVIGGDGSFSQVLNGIKNSLHPSTPIAYLPSGTGNDFARAAKLSMEPKELIDLLCNNPKVEAIDCGRFSINQQTWQYFVNNFGIGFDAYVVHQSNYSRLKKLLNKIKLGKLIYATNIIKALYAQDNFKVDIFAASKKYQFSNAYFATTTNHPYFGGGIAILPKANIHSHVLNTVVVEKPSLNKFIRLFIHLLKDGSHVNDPHFHNIEAKEIHLKTYKPEYGQIDGEDTKKRSFEITFQIDHFNLIH